MWHAAEGVTLFCPTGAKRVDLPIENLYGELPSHDKEQNY